MIDQRLFTRLAPLIVFAIIALFLAFGLTKDPRQLPSNLIDRPMPSFSLPDLYHPNQVHTDIDRRGADSRIWRSAQFQSDSSPLGL